MQSSENEVNGTVNDPTKVMVAGDWHGNPGWAAKAIRHAEDDADTIVHVGDFGFWTPSDRTHMYLSAVDQMLIERDMWLYWVDGNHEDHSQLDQWNKPQNATGPNGFGDFERIWHLPRGLRWSWWGMTFMSLGGAHSINRSELKEGHNWWPGEFLTDDQVQYASRPGSVDVIISHDAPKGARIPGIGDNHTPTCAWTPGDLVMAEEHRRLVRDVVDATQPRVLIHGHYHVKYRDQFYRDGGFTKVFGLDRDGSSLAANTMFLSPEGLGRVVSSG